MIKVEAQISQEYIPHYTLFQAIFGPISVGPKAMSEFAAAVHIYRLLAGDIIGKMISLSVNPLFVLVKFNTNPRK